MKYLILLVIFTVIFNSCNESLVTSKKNNLVAKLDMVQLQAKHLSNFNLTEKRVIWNRGRKFEFNDKNNQTSVSIQVGLYSSSQDAESIVLDYLNYLSIGMKEGQIDGKTIGDKLWYWPNSNPSEVTDIVFLRYNSLFILYSNNSEKLTELAEAIDNDIVSKADYINIANSILLPKIDSISVTNTILVEGETSQISVYASDPNNESLEYQCLTLNKSDLPNIFTFSASKDNVSAYDSISFRSGFEPLSSLAYNDKVKNIKNILNSIN